MEDALAVGFQSLCTVFMFFSDPEVVLRYWLEAQGRRRPAHMKRNTLPFAHARRVGPECQMFQPAQPEEWGAGFPSAHIEAVLQEGVIF